MSWVEQARTITRLNLQRQAAEITARNLAATQHERINIGAAGSGWTVPADSVIGDKKRPYLAGVGYVTEDQVNQAVAETIGGLDFTTINRRGAAGTLPSQLQTIYDQYVPRLGRQLPRWYIRAVLTNNPEYRRHFRPGSEFS